MRQRFGLGARLVAIGLVALLGACSGDDEPVDVPAADIAGVWTFTETIQDGPGTTRCVDEGTWQFTREGNALGGTIRQHGTCEAPGTGPFDNSGEGSLSEGRVTLDHVEFVAGGCTYTASLTSSTPGEISGTTTCPVEVNQVATLAGPWTAVRGTDQSPANARGTMATTGGDTVFVPGDVITISLEAFDDRALRWMGYRLGSPANLQDSTLVSGTHATAQYQLTVQPSWVTRPEVSFFARDVLGKSGPPLTAPLPVFDAVRRAPRSLQLPDAFTDLAYDPRRNVLYALQFARGEIAVVDLASFTLRTPLTFPPNEFSEGTRPGNRFELLPGGDTLVTGLHHRTGNAEFQLVNVVSGEVGTLPLGGQTFLYEFSVTANNKLFFRSSGISGGVTTQGLWELDIPSGAVVRRTDVGVSGGSVGLSSALARSGNYARLLFVDSDRWCGAMYDASTNQFSACSATGWYLLNATPSGSEAGDRWLAMDHLHDGAGNLLATLAGDFPGDRAVIAPEGTSAYITTPIGYKKVRLPDGATLQQVRYDPRIFALTALPGGRLILWSDAHQDRIILMDGN